MMNQMNDLNDQWIISITAQDDWLLARNHIFYFNEAAEDWAVWLTRWRSLPHIVNAGPFAIVWWQAGLASIWVGVYAGVILQETVRPPLAFVLFASGLLFGLDRDSDSANLNTKSGLWDFFENLFLEGVNFCNGFVFSLFDFGSFVPAGASIVGENGCFSRVDQAKSSQNNTGPKLHVLSLLLWSKQYHFPIKTFKIWSNYHWLPPVSPLHPNLSKDESTAAIKWAVIE